MKRKTYVILIPRQFHDKKKVEKLKLEILKCEAELLAFLVELYGRYGFTYLDMDQFELGWNAGQLPRDVNIYFKEIIK